MNIETTTGTPIDAQLFHNYFRNLINRFFKILPMRESNEASLVIYMQSLQAELLGCKNLLTIIDNDPDILALLSILQYLIDNPQYEVYKVKREVFRAISICNKIRAKVINNASSKDGEVLS